MNYFGSKEQVYKGIANITKGGLKKKDIILIDNKYKNKIKQVNIWANAVKQARKELGLTGFVPIGGKTKEGKMLLARINKIRKK